MKKLFPIFFILLLSMSVFGQSEDAEILFNKGEELYNAEKYEEAIPFFEKCNSLERNYSVIKIKSLSLMT